MDFFVPPLALTTPSPLPLLRVSIIRHTQIEIESTQQIPIELTKLIDKILTKKKIEISRQISAKTLLRVFAGGLREGSREKLSWW